MRKYYKGKSRKNIVQRIRILFVVKDNNPATVFPFAPNTIVNLKIET